ncbi:MAG: Rrf2 family transcriptional regulator [Phycisphaerales bacterium]
MLYGVGEVVRIIEGPLDPVRCIGYRNTPCCPLKEDCSLVHLASRAQAAIEAVYDGTGFQDLIEEEKVLNRAAIIDHSI